MAIIIPSKNIYEINNPKIKDNLINIVSIEQKNVRQIRKYNELVYENSFIAEDKNFEDWKQEIQADYGFKTDIGLISYVYYWGCVVAGLRYATTTIRVKILKSNENKNIQNLYYLNNEIKYSVEYRKYVGTANVETTFDYEGKNAKITKVNLNYDEYNFKMENSEIPVSVEVSEKTDYIDLTAKINYEELKNVQYSLVSDNYDYYEFDLTVPFKAELYKAKSYTENNKGETPTMPIIATGECEKYEPRSITFFFYGDIITIDLTDNSITYGDGNKPYSLSGNELLQTNANVNQTLLSEHLANNILNQYKYGKETATLLCDIANYFENDNLSKYAIKTTNLTYNNGIARQNEKFYNIEFFNVNYTLYGTSSVVFAVDGLDIVVVYIEIGEAEKTNNIYKQNITINIETSGSEIGLENELIIWLVTPNLEPYDIRIPNRTSQKTVIYEGSEPFTKNGIEILSKIEYETKRYPATLNDFNFFGYDKNNKLILTKTVSVNYPTLIELPFIKEKDLHFISFGTQGMQIIFDVSDFYNLERIFSVKINNITNGEVSFENLKITSNNNGKIISIDNDNLPMKFRIGDIVTPMILSENGNDVFMSLNKSGKPKAFEVVGINTIYDGAVWQQITLLEN